MKLQSTTKPRLIILAIVLIALLPVLIAKIAYTRHWFVGGMTKNKGELLQPLVSVTSVLPAKGWQLWLIYPKHCDKTCHQGVDKLLRIKMVLGKEANRVTPVLSLLDQSNDSLVMFHKLIQTQPLTRLQSRQLQQKYPNFRLDNAGDIFLVDPKGFALLHYPLAGAPDDIHADLTHLLKISQIG